MAVGNMYKYVKHVAKGFIITLPLCITFTDNVCSVARVHGISMQPSLNPEYKISDIIVLSRWAFRNFQGINRGDVVSLVDPHDPDITLVKRVIALEGDVVKTTCYKNRYVKIPRGHCWVEGDNRSHSLDSNTFGPVAIGLIQAKATRILWPPNRWGKIESGLPKGRGPLSSSEARHLDEELEDNDKRLHRRERIECGLPKGRGPLSPSEARHLDEEIENDEERFHRRSEEQKLTENDNSRQTNKERLPDYAFLPERNRTSHSIR